MTDGAARNARTVGGTEPFGGQDAGHGHYQIEMVGKTHRSDATANGGSHLRDDDRRGGSLRTLAACEMVSR
ncbi:MAG TPA: hypothetical protein VLN59_03715, partial [Burkholderiales bacterium]|nr:hypothetical protein [Burkholderiales bacterium]